MEVIDPPVEVFHQGEQTLQHRFGVREVVSRIGSRAVRNFLPEQHREFFGQIRYIFVGGADEAGAMWVTVLAGNPGFVSSPSPRELSIAAGPLADDPLAGALSADKWIGLLGLDLSNRRRNRANGRILRSEDGCLRLAVEQSFGNCPQYIWPRISARADDPEYSPVTSSFSAITDSKVADIISRADTFFVASRQPDEALGRGFDVSHRGGRPGFLRVEGGGLWWPEYAGNNYFNTLGNILVDPACGLLIPNFETGDVLHISGTAKLELTAADGPAMDGRLTTKGRVRFFPQKILHRPKFLMGHWISTGAARTASGPI